MLTGASNQDELTFADLYDVYERKMLRYATILVGDSYLAEDLVQDTFIRAIPHLTLLSGLEPHQRLAWLRKVMKNRFIDQQRARRREQELVEQVLHESDLVEDDKLPILTSELLEMASEKDRELLIQRYMLGMNSREIGVQLGVPAATVRSRLHLAVKRLRARQKMADFWGSS